jgi:WD40 repeat protein
MLSYFISQSNDYTIRTEDTASNEFTMSLTDMMGLNTYTASLSGIEFTPYENILAFTASISGAIVAGEYRALITNLYNDEPIWHGSIQVYASQSVDKTVYENKNTQYISHTSENKYIIYD